MPNRTERSTPALEDFIPSFPQPPVLASENGQLQVTLEVLLASHEFNGGIITTACYNGIIPGPTLKVRPGDTLTVHLTNRLPPNTDALPGDANIPNHPNTTNLHFHGLHVSQRGNGDNILLEVEPGGEQLFEIRIPSDHPAGTFWYHPHRHGSTAAQLYGGMCGAIIVDGDIDAVPEIAAAKDQVMIVQEIAVDENGLVPSMTDQLAFLQNTETTYCINGTTSTNLVMRTGEVQRWRFVHSGVTVYHVLRLEDHQLELIALDGISLPAPETVDSVTLVNGNRIDVLVRAGAPGTYEITRQNYPQTDRDVPSPVKIGQLEVLAGKAPQMALPTALPAPFANIEDSELTGHRELTFQGGPVTDVFTNGEFFVSGRKFDANRVDQTITLGSVEEWTIFNTDEEDDHPFHIHQNPFQLVQIGDTPVDRPVWLDTVNVPRLSSVKIRHRFLDFDGLTVLHCHILLHEDVGMMQLINLVPRDLSKRELRRREREYREVLARLHDGRRNEEFCGPRNSMRLKWGAPT
jgi:FtsP/CotA-like multicopper oxidase with cupredoxin domain